jgi:dihydrofolate reductase
MSKVVAIMSMSLTDGIESAVNKATAAAGGKSVGVDGADTIQQCLNAGLLDKIHVDIPGVGVTHLRYSVRKA